MTTRSPLIVVYYFRPIGTLFIDVTIDTFTCIMLVPASDFHSEINNLKSDPNHKNTELMFNFYCC